MSKQLKKLLHKQLFKNIFMISIPVVLSSFVLIYLLFKTDQTSSLELSISSSQRLMQEFISTLDILDKDVEQIIFSLEEDYNFSKFMIIDNLMEDYSSYKVMAKELAGKLMGYCVGNSKLYSISIYSESANYTFGTKSSGFIDKVNISEWQNSYENANSNNRIYINNKEYLTIVKPYFKNQKFGAIIININNNVFENLLNKSNSYFDYMCIANKNGDIIFPVADINNNIKSNYDFLDETSSLIKDKNLYLLSKNDNYILISKNSISKLSKNNSRISFEIIIFMFCIFLIILLIATLISYFMTNKVKRIVDVLAHENAYYKDTSSSEDYNNIYYYITSKLKQHMSINKEQLEENLIELKKAQSTALQAQITPHFIFNTLQTIELNAYELTGSSNSATKLIKQFSTLLRNSFSTKSPLLTIKEELQNLNSYIIIQQARYNDLFDYIVELDDYLSEFLIPKLTLQPIVENSIYHGIKPQQEKKLIKLSFFDLGDQIKITIFDNGVGFEKEKLQKLNRIFKAENNNSKYDGVGLQNVNNRIKLIFTNNYGIEISEINSGSEVVVLIPKVQ